MFSLLSDRKTQFWLFCFAFFSLFFWLFSSVLSPFVVGIIVAYLLNPLVSLLIKKGASRLIASVVLLSLFFIAIAGLLLLLLPPLYQESLLLADQLPVLLEQLWDRLNSVFQQVGQGIAKEEIQANAEELIRSNVGNAAGITSRVISSLFSGGRALMDFLSFILLTPLVAFLMLLKWESLVSWCEDLLPRESRTLVMKLVEEIDRKISSFIRGQLLVSLALGVIYAFALSITGLQYGFVIGIFAGVLSIIPLFGSTVGLLIAVAVAWFQYQSFTQVGIVAAIFMAGQVLEGNVLTPKLVGNSVGLDPLWILFSLLAGGALFGIVGMMIAVPVTATIGVLLGYAIEQYKDSELYKN